MQILQTGHLVCFKKTAGKIPAVFTETDLIAKGLFHHSPAGSGGATVELSGGNVGVGSSVGGGGGSGSTDGVGVGLSDGVGSTSLDSPPELGSSEESGGSSDGVGVKDGVTDGVTEGVTLGSIDGVMEGEGDGDGEDGFLP